MESDDRSVDSLESFSINGIQQWVLARGTDRDNPLLLFLHGGPGFSQIAFAPVFQKKLETDFLVVNWDQRGAGKSYYEYDQYNLPTLEDFIDDLHLLVAELLKEYEKDKIAIVGHSWGSTLGTRYCEQYPEHVAALICCGYGINFRKGEEMSLQYLSGKAEEAGDTLFFKEMEPYKSGISKSNFAQYIEFKSKWMGKYGGYFTVPYSKLFVQTLPFLLSFKYYGIKDFAHWVRGIRKGRDIGVNILLDIDLFAQAAKVDVPLFFFIGRHDYHTPWEMARKYYEMVESPHKEWVWFEDSAHSPNFEEVDAFAETMVKCVLPRFDGARR